MPNRLGQSSTQHHQQEPLDPDDDPGAPVAFDKAASKPSVAAACGPCKRAHLACDIARPCNRCIKLGKKDICEDVPVSLQLRCQASHDLEAPGDCY